MKKILGLLLVMMMLVTPFTVKAVTADDSEVKLKNYETLGFREILAEEGIKEDFTNYEETDDQITIYLFRGHGCGYCQNFLKFMNSITEEYGKYFKVVGFEVWNDAENSKLLDKISEFMGSKASGVPFIIIGDQVIPGYAASFDDSIKAAITTLYNTKAEERYDAFEAYNEAVKEAKRAEFKKFGRPIVFSAVFVAIGTAVVCFFIKKQNEILLGKITEQRYSARPTVKETHEEAPKQTKVVKKTTKRRR